MDTQIKQEFQNHIQGFRTSKPPNPASSRAARPSIPFVRKNRPLRGSGAHGRAGPPSHGCTSAMGLGTQNTCRQVFGAAHMHHGTCRNLPKTSAGRCFGHTRRIMKHAVTCSKTSACRCFGHTRHIMKHAVTCSKRLPAGVLGTPGTLRNML